MNMLKALKRVAPAPRAMRTLTLRDVEAVSGGTLGEMNPIHAPTAPPIVYTPILMPFPFRRLPG